MSIEHKIVFWIEIRTLMQIQRIFISLEFVFLRWFIAIMFQVVIKYLWGQC